MTAPLVRLGTAADLPLVRPLWQALYQQQQEQGMLLPVPEGGFDAWAKSLESVVGRFGCLVLGGPTHEPIGFVAGRTRALPGWFGGGQAGFITDVFVGPAERGKGLGRQMLDAAAKWFSAQGIKRLELQVIMGNRAAREAYLSMGWEDELVQMVKSI